MDETRITVQGADGQWFAYVKQGGYWYRVCDDGFELAVCPNGEVDALIAAYQAQARRIEELEAERDALKGQGYVAEAAVESEHEAYADLKAETARLRKALRDIEGIAWGKDTMISGLRKRIAAIAAAEAPKEGEAHGT